jgi:hypothetical protein
MADSSRRFTDREVALVLKAASEIDVEESASPGKGLSVDDLHQIAQEVGISREAIDKAIDRLGQRAESRFALSGAPLVQKAVHAVDGELNEEALGRLIRLVDERASSAGTISEALGSVRWTSSDRFYSTQVQVTPADGETSIQVVEKAMPRMRRVLHGVPAAWGMILTAGPATSAGLPVALTLGAVGLGALAGVAAGRAAWGFLSGRSGTRVARLAAELTEEARRASGKGLLVASTDEEGGKE